MDLINEYAVDSLAYVDKEYDEPYMQSIVNNLIVEEMKCFKPDSARYLAHLPPIRTTGNGLLTFGSSSALQTAYAEAAAKVNSGAAAQPSKQASGEQLQRYPLSSLRHPGARSSDATSGSQKSSGGALAKDLHAWRRVISNAKVQTEYNANHLMNIELQQQMMSTTTNSNDNNSKANPKGSSSSSVGGDIWLGFNEAVEGSINATCNRLIGEKKRAVDEVNRTRYMEQMAANSELAKLEKRRKVATDNCVGIIEQLGGPQAVASLVAAAAAAADKPSDLDGTPSDRGLDSADVIMEEVDGRP